jgi:hypothetical protein
MTVVSIEERNAVAEDYLHLLRSIAIEMERAMQAIANNRLQELEESVASQQALSDKLGSLVHDLCRPLEPARGIRGQGTDDELMSQIFLASESLQQLNRRYAALLRHSGRSAALMASLFGSFRGQFQEASGTRLRQHTWSCQM